MKIRWRSIWQGSESGWNLRDWRILFTRKRVSAISFEQDRWEEGRWKSAFFQWPFQKMRCDGKWRYLDPVESSQSCFRFPRNEGEYLQTIKSCHAVVCLLSMSCSRCRIYWFSLTKEYRGGPSGDDESSTYPFSVNNWKCRCLYRIISSRVDSGSIDELPPLSFPAILRRCGDWLNVDNGIRNNI